MSQQFVPIYCRPPNQLIGYTHEPYDDGAGHYATLTIAHFVNKNKKKESMVAQVKWHSK